jgi:putative ABC transport system permease protein
MRKKFYSAINIIGLSIGIACSFLIFLFIQSELSYDKHYKNAENIYRLAVEYNMGGKIDRYCNIPRPIGPNLKAMYPEILEYTRLSGVNGLKTHKAIIEFEGNKFSCDKIFAADSTFFQVFNNEFIKGNPKDALVQPNSIILTESYAKSIFGSQEPFGKTIIIDNEYEMNVVAVIKDIPGKTHMEYEAIVPWNVVYREGEENVWYGWHVYTYVKFPNNYDIAEFEAKFPEFYEKYMLETFERFDGTCKIILQPLKSIHLTSDLTWEAYPNGNIMNVYIFSIIAVFLLVIACINYMNLATARSAHRSREVGLRKIFGSYRSSLVWQFITESIIIALLATIVAIAIAEIALPLFNNLLINHVEINFIKNPVHILGLFGMAIFIGFFAGTYPAFYLSAFMPIRVIKGNLRKSNKGTSLRKILIVIQFSISIALIIGTLIVLQQIDFAKNKELGFNKENIMVISIKGSLVDKQIPIIKEEFLANPDITAIATSYNLPGIELNHTTVSAENDEGGFDPVGCQFMQIDYDFVDLLNMKIIEGRNFNREIDREFWNGMLINEAAARKFGWKENVLEKGISSSQDSDGNNIKINVLGIIKDFHVGSLHSLIQPIVIFLIPDDGDVFYRSHKQLFIRLKNENIFETVKHIRNEWSRIDPNNPIDYVFLDEKFDELYKAEEKLINLFSYFSFITVFIACLGLLGLASFTAEQRTKEIGIRKVLGASVSTIIILLSKEFTKWVLISNIIAWPIAFYAMNKWLQNFAYRIHIGLGIFILSGIIAMLIAIFTVSYQAFKAANANPIEALKYE